MKHTYPFLRCQPLFTLLLLLLALAARAQAPAWQMAITKGTNDMYAIGGTTTDASGNVLLSGTFTGRLQLGAITLTSAGFEDVFVAKWNPTSSRFVWVQRAGGQGSDYCNDVVVSGANIYLTGSFGSPVLNFGNSPLNGPPPASSDLFVAKLVDAGSSSAWTWVQQARGAGQLNKTSLAVSGTSVYVTGSFSGVAATFGSTTLSNSGPTGSSGDVYVAKLTDAGSSGSWAWAQQILGSADEQSFDIAASGTSVYVSGFFKSATATFGSIVVPSQNTVESCAFLAKLTDAGASSTWTWAQTPGGEAARALAVVGTSIYVAGDFGRFNTFGTIVLPQTGLSDIFVTKLTDTGAAATTVWAQRAGGSDAEYANGLCVSGSSVYVVGMFGSPTATFGSTVLRPVDNGDIFVSRLNDAGTSASWAWTQSAGSVFFDEARAVTVSGSTVCVTGYAHRPISFGDQVFINPRGSEEPFFATLSDVPLLPTLTGISPLGGAVGSTVALTGTNLTGATAVTFTGAANATVTTGFTANATGTRLSGIVVPTGATTGPITVTTPTGISTGVSFSVGAASSAAPPWQPVSTFNEVCKVTGTVADAAGNVYLTGYFSGTVAFGSTTLTSQGVETDVFVAKWNRATSAFVWAQRAGGIGTDSPTAIALSGSSVYITGYYESVTAIFGGTTITNTGTTGRLGDRDIFISKLTDNGSTGSFTWTQSAGGNYTDMAYGIAVSGPNVYVAGDFDGLTVNFGGITVATASPPASTNGYIAKLTDAGASSSFTWAYPAGRTDFIRGLAVNGNNIYIGGSFLDTATFGNTTITSLDGNMNFDVFVAKMTDAGPSATFTWAVRAGGVGREDATALAVSGSSVYLGGSFISPAVYFGNTTLINASNNDDAFVAKLTDAGPSGDFVWAQRLGGTSFDAIQSLAANGSNLYLTGVLDRAAVDFGSTQLTAGPTDGFLAQISDAGSSYRFSWAKLVGSTGYDAVSALAVNGPNVYIGGYVTPTVNFDSYNVTTPVGATGAVGASFLTSLTDASLPLPTLSGISPGSGGTGSSVTLTGTNLTRTSTITFAGTANNTVTSGFVVNAAGTQLTGVIVPSGAATGPVSVTTPDGTSNGVTFTLAGAPGNDDPAGALALTPGPACTAANGTTTDATPSITPGLSTPAQSRDVFYSFVATETAISVYLESPLTSTAVALELYAGPVASLTRMPTTDSGSGSIGRLTLYATGLTIGQTYFLRANATTAGGAGQPFTVCITNQVPAIASFSPAIGTVGTVVTVTGTTLSGVTMVYFNGVPQPTITNNTATSFQVTVPNGATTGRLTVLTPTSTLTSAGPYTVPEPGLDVSYGAGTSVQSSGRFYDFGPQILNTTSATASFLLINRGNGPLTISSVTATGDFAVVGTYAATVAPNNGYTFVNAAFTPTAAGVRNGTVVITSNAGIFIINLTGTGRVAAPYITSLAPLNAMVGATITITGTGMSGATGVYFNGAIQSTIVGNTGTRLQVAVPSGATSGFVQVRTPAGFSNDVYFTIIAPPASSWQTALSLNQPTSSRSSVTATATDASGNVYLAGQFSGVVTFGGTTLTSAGGSDVFVAKWSPASQGFAWAMRAGGSATEEATALAVSGSAVYVAGSFNSNTADFGPATLTTAGGSDVFVARLTDAGSAASFGWAQRAGGPGPDAAQALAVNGAAVYVAGSFSGTSAGFGSNNLASAGTDDLFVTKLVDAGTTATFAWAQRAGGPAQDGARALAVAGTDIYVAGAFGGAAGFGSRTLTSAGSRDIFVAKLTDLSNTANFVWAEQAGGPADDVANAVAISGANVYVAGNFLSATAAFGSSTLTNADATAQTSDVFIAKLTDAGSSAGFGWVERSGGPADDVATALIASGSRIYAAGYYQSATAGFGPIALSNAGSAGSSDLFVAKLLDFGSTGSITWAQSAGGTGSDMALALAEQGANVVVAGTVVPTAGFGSLVIASPTNTPVGFLASFSDIILATAHSTLSGELLGLYPNPAHRSVTVELPALPGTSQVTLTLLNALGQRARVLPISTSASRRQYSLDLTGLPPGLYVVQLQAGASQLSKRLVVE